jgi:DNA processing protein
LLIEDLAPLDPIIVSGFAYGVDIAHQLAMEHNLNDRLVAHGLNQIYRKPIKKYVSKVEQNGGFMTGFGVHPIQIKKILLEETESLQECLKRQS